MKPAREMTRRQFAEALNRNGFKQMMMWFTDTTGQTPHLSSGAILYRNGKVARRATLAHCIRARDAEVARMAKAAQPAERAA